MNLTERWHKVIELPYFLANHNMWIEKVYVLGCPWNVNLLFVLSSPLSLFLQIPCDYLLQISKHPINQRRRDISISPDWQDPFIRNKTESRIVVGGSFCFWRCARAEGGVARQKGEIYEQCLLPPACAKKIWMCSFGNSGQQSEASRGDAKSYHANIPRNRRPSHLILPEK